MTADLYQFEYRTDLDPNVGTLVVVRSPRTRADAVSPPRSFDLETFEDEFAREVESAIRRELEEIPGRVAAMYEDSPDRRTDRRTDVEFAVDILAWISDSRERIVTRIDGSRFRDVLRTFFVGMETRNFRALRNTMRTVLAVDPLDNEPEIARTVDEAVRISTRKITGTVGLFHEEIADVVVEGFREGTRTKTIAKRLEKRFGVSRSRARFIARNELGNANAKFTEIRQTQNGFTSYVWRTSQDERVRESHAAKEGRTFRWNSPPPDTGHPGEDFNCRCTAEPVFDDDEETIEEVDPFGGSVDEFGNRRGDL